MRFTYNNDKIQPSNISTNDPITDISNIDSDNSKPAYFEFSDKFKKTSGEDQLQMTTTKTNAGIMNTSITTKTPMEASENIIIEDTTLNTGKAKITGEVLIGKMSFEIKTADIFDIDWFKLEKSETNEPKTGIKINLDGTNTLSEQGRFIFTDATASHDATLRELIVSREVTKDVPEGEEPQTETKLYDIGFATDKLDYNLEINENIDTLDIKPVKNDAKAKLKIKVPERDAEDKLVYEKVTEDDGTGNMIEVEKIKYKEIDLEVDEEGNPVTESKHILTLNKLRRTKYQSNCYSYSRRPENHKNTHLQ